MATTRPTTIAGYIAAAPAAARPHLRRLYAILKAAAPDATEAIKWGTPFFVEPRFVEPRFVFAFSAHKAHVSFAPMQAVMEAFRKELEGHDTTANMLKVRYDADLPEDLIRRMAEHCVEMVGEREDDGFW